MSNDPNDKNKALFLSLVQSLAANCWIQLGKHINPISGKLEKNLQEASFTIDLLDMIRIKTKGNLDNEESLFIEKTISELKMNYVDEKLKEEKEASKKQEEEKKKEDNRNKKGEKSGEKNKKDKNKG
ncbi:MAG: DUF1844 domain-containing protein [Candidatus Marinimicrobia bacterium]|nr:DUF1844 domain-containing protein [Candidatus Neomarinimicrobiota bacterium]